MPSKDGLIWSPDKLFCVWTWNLLRDLEENLEAFRDSGDIRMDRLEFWNPSASPDGNKLKAQELAAKLNNLLIRGKLAVYEPGFSAAPAIAAMGELIAIKTNTLRHLAAAINVLYRFKDES